MKPVVGLSAYREPAQWGDHKDDADLLPCLYVDAVALAGGAPLLLPAITGVHEVLAARIDALVLTGGPDVDAALYDATPHQLSDKPRRQRDVAEAAYLSVALERGIPILGICRGMQMLNVLHGGSLIQYLPDVATADAHSPDGADYVRHAVNLEARSRLAAISGSTRLTVDSHHHQAADRIGTGLVATAWADDGIVEAIEDPSRAFLLGVQWHPEAGTDLRVFEALVAACAATLA